MSTSVQSTSDTSITLLESSTVPSIVNPADGRLKKIWIEKGPMCVLTLQGINTFIDMMAIGSIISGYTEMDSSKVQAAALTTLVSGITLMPAASISSALMHYPDSESLQVYIRQYNAAKITAVVHSVFKIIAFLPCSYMVLLTKNSKESSNEATFTIYLLMVAAMATYAGCGIIGGINCYRQGWSRLC